MEVDGKIAPKLPIHGERNILITSALPYVTNVPHLGNIIGGVLSADVYARYCGLRGYNAIYICGTDEYGTATETKALEEKCTPMEICDKYHAVHKEVYDWFDISFDMFGRTSTPEHTQLCHAFFNNLWENNCLSENTMQQLYCYTCDKFLADRLAEGSCPLCKYDSAPGDQSKSCGKPMNPTELDVPRCKVCQAAPRIRNTDHLFIDLPKSQEYFDKTSVSGSWFDNAIQTTKACITRDTKWGVPVPHQKYKDKVFYPWFDAPIGYVSITSCYTPEWEKWWTNPENVELYQFMGEDSGPFHTVMVPCTQLGTGENWTIMKTLSVTGYLHYEEDMFSKSKDVVLFCNDVKQTNIPVEVWRYYLLTNRPEASETSFYWEDLQGKLNNELLGNLGIFVHRVLSFIAKPESGGYGCVIPDAPGADSHGLTVSLGEKVGKLVEKYIKAMERVKLKKGLKTAMLISSEGNRYLKENQFGELLELYYKDEPLCAIVIRSCVGLIHLLARLLEPFMPSFSREVFKQLNLPPHISLSDEEGEVLQASRPWEILPPGHRICTPQPLFQKMRDKEVKRYKKKFGGSQADKRARDEEAACRRAKDAKEARRLAKDAKAARRRAQRHAARVHMREVEAADLIRKLRMKRMERLQSRDSALQAASTQVSFAPTLTLGSPVASTPHITPILPPSGPFQDRLTKEAKAARRRAQRHAARVHMREVEAADLIRKLRMKRMERLQSRDSALQAASTQVSFTPTLTVGSPVACSPHITPILPPSGPFQDRLTKEAKAARRRAQRHAARVHMREVEAADLIRKLRMKRMERLQSRDSALQAASTQVSFAPTLTLGSPVASTPHITPMLPPSGPFQASAVSSTITTTSTAPLQATLIPLQSPPVTP